VDQTTSFPDEVYAIRLETLRSRSAGMAVWAYRAGPWLVDAGFAHARRQLLRWDGLKGVEACILTHHHEDHVGNAAALAAHGIDVIAPPRVIEWLPETRKRLPLYRWWIWGHADVADVTDVDGPLRGSGWTLDPIHTPGHAPDHHVLFEPERRLLFSADLYIARRVPVARLDEDPETLLDSLRRVRDLRPDTMFCAHRGRIASPVQALNEKIGWLEDLVDGARALRREGLEVKEIARRLLGREGAITWISGGELSKRNLVRVSLVADDPARPTRRRRATEMPA